MPTVNDVREKIAEFNRENEQVEWLLTELFAKYHKNTDYDAVLVKTKVLNLLYNTAILAIGAVARPIVALSGLDTLLAAESPDAVGLIANVSIQEKKYWFFSFATKYCSWHNPTAYPIFDKNVYACLRFYRKQDRFAKFALKDLWDYSAFLGVVTEFRRFYGLEQFNFKELDKFLYQHGSSLPPLSGIRSEADPTRP
jgi:hypothetical protein